METLPQDFIDFVRDLQAHVGHEPHSFKLAQQLGMTTRLGETNYVMPAAKPAPVLTLSQWFYAGNNDVVRHEAAHVMLYWSGLERRVIEEYGFESGMKVVERLCNQAVAFLQITQPMVDTAIKRYGVSARAVRYLQRVAKASEEKALARLIYDNHRASRAGFITSGAYIAQTEDCNHGLPFYWLDRIPEPALLFPPDANLSAVKVPHRAKLIGVCGW